MKAIHASIAAAALAALTPATNADDAALYGPEAPPGSAFIRVFNASDVPDLQAQIGEVAIDDVDAWEVGSFEYLPPGSKTLSAGNVESRVDLQPNRFYTAVVDGRRVHLLDNAGYGNRLKALLILYNLTDAGALSLRTSDGSTTVIDAVGSGTYGTREVNAARARLTVFAGERRVAETELLTLSRGKALSLFAIGPADAPRLVLAQN